MGSDIRRLIDEVEDLTKLIFKIVKIVRDLKSKVSHDIGRSLAYTLVLVYSSRMNDHNIIQHRIVQRLTDELGLNKEEAEKIAMEAINEIMGFEVPVSEEERELYDALGDKQEDNGEA